MGGTKDPDLAAIVALAPDLVVVNDEENRLADADALTAAGLRLHVTHVEAVDDVDPCLDALAAAVGVERPRGSGTAFRRLGAVPAAPPVGRRSRSAVRPDLAASVDDDEPGHLRRVGPRPPRPGRPVRRRRRSAIRPSSSTRSRPGHPDLVLLPSEPYPFRERHRADVAGLAADVRLVDGQDLFWWGVRTPAAIDRLRQSIGA